MDDDVFTSALLIHLFISVLFFLFDWRFTGTYWNVSFIRRRTRFCWTESRALETHTANSRSTYLPKTSPPTAREEALMNWIHSDRIGEKLLCHEVLVCRLLYESINMRILSVDPKLDDGNLSVEKDIHLPAVNLTEGSGSIMATAFLGPLDLISLI